MSDLSQALGLKNFVKQGEKPYEGPGERTGAPGHYKYSYHDHDSAHGALDGVGAVRHVSWDDQGGRIQQHVYTHKNPVHAKRALLAHLRSSGVNEVKTEESGSTNIVSAYTNDKSRPHFRDSGSHVEVLGPDKNNPGGPGKSTYYQFHEPKSGKEWAGKIKESLKRDGKEYR